MAEDMADRSHGDTERGSMWVRRLVAYKEIEKICKYVGDHRSQSFTIRKGSYKYGKGERLE